jgi:hypothetical protein
MSNVIEIKWYQEQRRREKERAREALRELLTGSPSVAPASGVAPAPGKVVVIPGKSDDPEELENFNRGFAAGFEASRYNPKSTGAGYGCGYFGGITAREYRNQMVQDGRQPPWGAILVNWHRFSEGIRDVGEVFDDELEKMPKGRPYPASIRIRDACMGRDMMALTDRHDTTGKIIAEIMDRYGVSESTARRAFDSDKFDFSGWFRVTG